MMEHVGAGTPHGSGVKGRLAQLVRAPALQAGGRRFKSCTAHQCFQSDSNSRIYDRVACIRVNFRRIRMTRSPITITVVLGYVRLRHVSRVESTRQLPMAASAPAAATAPPDDFSAYSTAA